MNSLGDRMKSYESVSKGHLMPNSAVIIRVDGKAFHTFTKAFDKPFSRVLMRSMDSAAEFVAKDMQGCKAFYVQSDEVSFLLTDTDSYETQGWFDYNRDKLVSLSASMMTWHFDSAMSYNLPEYDGFALFDSRAFNVPFVDVPNYFVWRARDWHRNSIQMYARSFFSHKELHGKNIDDIHEMLHSKGKNWATDLTDREKNGNFRVLKDRKYQVVNHHGQMDYVFFHDALHHYIASWAGSLTTFSL